MDQREFVGTLDLGEEREVDEAAVAEVAEGDVIALVYGGLRLHAVVPVPMGLVIIGVRRDPLLPFSYFYVVDTFEVD